MNKWKKFSGLVPVAIGVFVAVCIVVSLTGYEAPVYEVSAAQDEYADLLAASEEEEPAADGSSTAEKVTEAVPTEAAAQGAAQTYTDGVYKGSAQGYGGTTTVQVTVSGGKITDITVLSQNDTEPFWTLGSSVIQTILGAQTTDVDTVSGATFTSKGIINAVKNALAQAGGEPADESSSSAAAAASSESTASVAKVSESKDWADGTYEGTGRGFQNGTTRVSVTISGGKIASITIVSNQDTAAYFSRARVLTQRIISAQSTNVDTVSGATFSSRGIIEAVRSALSRASGNKVTDVPTATPSPSPTPIPSVTAAAGYNDGTYEGSGLGFLNGTTRLRVTISNNKITGITVISTEDTEEYFTKARAILTNMVAADSIADSLNVDSVSGATFSSRGIIQAVRNAVEQAVSSGTTSTPTPAATATPAPSEEKNFPYADGIYEGVGEGRNDEIHLYVVIQNQQMKAVLVKSEDDDATYFSRAMTGILQYAVSKQAIPDLSDSEVYDTVSGATMSSEGLIEALQDAVEKAKEGKNIDYVEPTGTGTPAVSATTTPTPAATGTVPSATSAPTATPDPSEITVTPAPTTSPASGSETPSPEPTPAGSTSVYRDGTYTETVWVEPDDDTFEGYNLTASVTITGDKITEILDARGSGAKSNNVYIKWALEGRGTSAGVRTQIVSKGNAEGIDTVSHATCSSKALIEICQKALADARVNG